MGLAGVTVGPVRLLTLNLANPTRSRARGLLEWLWLSDSDVWVLTETGPGDGTRLMEAVCRQAGDVLHLTDATERGVMIVVRDRALAVTTEDLEPPLLLPGRVLPLRVSGLRLLGVYGAASDPVRYASARQRQRKRLWMADFDRWLTTWRPAGAGVLLGDLNLVDPLHTDRLPYVLAEETALLAALSERHQLVDAYRLRHPDAREVSWVDHSGAGCRYDHAFVSRDLAGAVAVCGLDHVPRTSGLTDHSALRLTLAI